eukprot:JP437179.1.p1 GENE.JP437179.1~~JP437179.1.p1  ORF type:complete len:175 (-),score=13.58 JP437179.1:68-592(-)
MEDFHIKTCLPECILQELRDRGAVFREDCKIKIVELFESDQADQHFDSFLLDKKEVDPVLHPTFGDCFNPYLSAPAQYEVLRLLASFQPLMAADLDRNAPVPLVPAFLPGAAPLFFQYHHAKIALQRVQKEIEAPCAQLLPQLPLLTAVHSGNVICDLNITYSNCIIRRRVRKS